MKTTLFEGSAVALITPFDKTGKHVDFDKLGELVEFHIKNGTDALVVCGTTGEAPTLEDDEHLKAVEYSVEKCAGRIPVIAGTGSNNTEHSIMMTKAVENFGVDGILSVTPYYNKATQKGLYKHYEAIASNTSLPIILYNVPSRTGVNIAPATVKQLAGIPNITAIKEASGNISQVAQIASLCGNDIDIYSGNDDQIVPIMSLGGKGVISVVANVAPKQTHDVVMKYLEGDTKGSLKMQLEMLELVNSLFCEVNPIPVKTAMNIMGFEVGPVRLPLCEMEDKNILRLKSALKDYGLI